MEKYRNIPPVSAGWIFPQCEDSQSLDTKLKLMAHIKLEMEALMAQIKTKTHTIQQYNTISDSNWHCNGIQT